MPLLNVFLIYTDVNAGKFSAYTQARLFESPDNRFSVVRAVYSQTLILSQKQYNPFEKHENRHRRHL